MATKPRRKLTADEKERLKKQVERLQAALAEQDEADTPAEEKEAAEEVDEQRERTAALFDRLGLDEDDFDLLVGAVGAGIDTHVREIIREELDDPAGGETGGLGALQDDPGAGPVDVDTAEEEPTPTSEHWTRRRLFGSRKDEPEDEEEGGEKT